MSGEQVCEVVVTAPSPDWLADFTRKLVDQRLCAAGHNVTTVRSIYRWRDIVHDEGEARVALHTRRSLVPTIIDRVNQAHPYEVACVVALPVVEGDEAYLRWVLEETESPRLDSEPATWEPS